MKNVLLLLLSGNSAVGWLVRRERMTVPHDLNTDFALFERHFENLVGEIAVHVEFVERFREKFSLEREVHADRTVETDKPGVERYIRIFALFPGVSRGPRKCSLFFVTRTQSSSSKTRFSSQSFQPDLPIHTTCEAWWWPRWRAIKASSELRHSSMRSFVTAQRTGACGEGNDIGSLRRDDALLWSAALRIRFCKERGEFHLFPIEAGIGRENPLHRNAGGHRRSHIVHRDPCSLDDGSSAQNLVIDGDLGAGGVQTQ